MVGFLELHFTANPATGAIATVIFLALIILVCFIELWAQYRWEKFSVGVKNGCS